MAKAKKKPPKAGTKANPYASPEALAKYDFETQKGSYEREQSCADSERIWKEAKARATDAKKTHEANVIELRAWDRERAEARGKPPKSHLFTKAEDKEKSAEMTIANAPLSATEAAPGWFPENLWASFPTARLAEFGLTDSEVKKIQAGEVKKGSGIGPLMTMGDLTKFCEPVNGYSRNYGDLKGVGNAVVERLHVATAKFWESWREGLDAKYAIEQGHKPPEPANGNESTEGDGAKDSGGSNDKPDRKPKKAVRKK